jgi:hypothetical protein
VVPAPSALRYLARRLSQSSSLRRAASARAAAASSGSWAAANAATAPVEVLRIEHRLHPRVEVGSRSASRRYTMPGCLPVFPAYSLGNRQR